MPMLNIQCTKNISKDLMKELSAVLAVTIGKPESYVMVAATQSDILMAGAEGDAAYGEVKSIGGLDRVINHDLSMKIAILLNDHLGIPQNRVYITFRSVEADHWGWKGKTFG